MCGNKAKKLQSNMLVCEANFSIQRTWRRFKKSTIGVFVKDLSTKEFDKNFNVSIFKVMPGGKFPNHHHNHSHVMYFLGGVGEYWVGQERCKAEPGRSALVESGKEHGYINTGKTDLTLIVINSPATR